MMGAIHVLLTPHRNYIKGKNLDKKTKQKVSGVSRGCLGADQTSRNEVFQIFVGKTLEMLSCTNFFGAPV